MARILPHPSLSLVIAGLWVILAPGFTLGQFLVGALLGLTIPLLTGRFWPDRMRLARPGVGLRLFARVIGDIILANWQVARIVLGPLDRINPALILVPLDIEDPFVATILGSIVSLTPGTVSIEIDRARRQLLVHALDVSDERKLVESIKSRYEAPLKELFAC
jgi:multicomponent K+:H+ antiporter subunit E